MRCSAPVDEEGQYPTFGFGQGGESHSPLEFDSVGSFSGHGLDGSGVEATLTSGFDDLVEASGGCCAPGHEAWTIELIDPEGSWENGFGLSGIRSDDFQVGPVPESEKSVEGAAPDMSSPWTGSHAESVFDVHDGESQVGDGIDQMVDMEIFAHGECYEPAKLEGMSEILSRNTSNQGKEDGLLSVTFLGLGVMGWPMAGHLVRAGHEVTVYNRTAAKALGWVATHGGRAAPTPGEASLQADVVMVCVGNDDDVRSVVFGEHGALNSMSAGSILVDHTTASADLARELSGACTSKGVGFVDAPVSGGQAGAVNGTLTVMCGSDDVDVFARAKVVIGAFARACALLGPAGSGQLTKMVNQICIAGIVQGLAEGINFAQRAGLDVEAVVDVIGKGAAASWQMENRAETMGRGEFEFGFAVEWMRKDLGICIEEAHRNGARLPLTALVDQFYAHVVGRGGKRWDTSSLIHLLQND